MTSEFYGCLNMVRDGVAIDNGIAEIFGVISLHWQIPSKSNKTDAVIYMRLPSSVSKIFCHEFENAVECMGEDASLASPSQIILLALNKNWALMC